MAHIVGKKIGKETYYYLREMARVEGQPKVVWQRYLGKAGDIAAAVDAGGGGGVEAERSRHLGFGGLAAVWGVLARLGYAGIVDEVLGPRRADAAASVGTYLALACANRVLAPRSKLGFADWWATTAGGRMLKIPAAATDHRRFWDAMDIVDEDALVEIERGLAVAMAAEFDLELSGVALDMTNFATFIDSGNDRAPIAQRGHAKQKRADLRLVGLGMVVTRDGSVPLVGHADPGNRPDVAVFPAVVDELVTRYRALAAEDDELTVVFDAGQNSAANFAHLAEVGLHFVGSLPPSEHPDLLAIPARARTVVDTERYGGLSAVEARVAALGATRRVVLTHSPTLHAKQAAGFDQTLAKATRALTELAATLARGRARRDRAGVQAAIDRITRPRWLDRVLRTTLTGDTPAELRLSFTVDTTARTALETELFGKRLLVTDRDDWTVPDVIAGYRSQSDAEAGFRQLKDPHLVSFSPMWHWTDSKIRVHLSYCVTALAIAHLMRRQTRHAGLDMSVRELLGHLTGIEETLLLYPSTGGRPRARRMLTEMSPTQQQLYDLFDLDQYAPTRRPA
ncbi:MAG TPA: IS1634 family transposase [Pseudonocardiaceae bacterium]|nr:IS1634 family transposase [Pseudonocardiaceae bacterium]